MGILGGEGFSLPVITQTEVVNVKITVTDNAINQMKKTFFSISHKNRTRKHISDPLKGSAAKRINMFLRWMVRSNKKKVDFELWKSISPSQLSCPLDIHTGRVARKLKILKRNQNDFKATLELDSHLKEFNPCDPVKYDFALFGLGTVSYTHLTLPTKRIV